MGNHWLRIAVVEDDPVTRERLAECLSGLNYQVTVFSEGESFWTSFLATPHDLIISDLRLPGIDGLEILRRVKKARPETEVLVITGYASVDTAIEAIRNGAFHYLTKPFRLDEFENLIQRIIEKIELQSEAKALRASALKGTGFEGMVGSSPEIGQVFRLVEKIAPLDCSVLIQGESGTGKELVARAIHRLSPRTSGPFICFNCGGFTPELIANELFGHEKGSYTGAFSTSKGLMESAGHGTVFLDEIAEMPPDMQVKLLRVLQERQIYRVGGNVPIPLDIRVLAATNKDLTQEVRGGRFREDLYFRINIVSIFLPTLVERQGDLPLLIEFFLKKYNQAYKKTVEGLTPDALDVLRKYPFPGNVRELENIIARAVVLCEGPVITQDNLPPLINADFIPGTQRLKTLEELEREYIKHVMAKVGHSRGKAAQALGITRSTLWRKIKQYGLDTKSGA